MKSSRVPRIAAVGLASWHRIVTVDHYPPSGGSAIIQAEDSRPGSTSLNAVALARLGARVAFVGVVGEDEQGMSLRAALEASGVDTHWLATRHGEPTDAATVIIGNYPIDRTLLRRPGSQIVRGERLDIAAVFEHDVVLLDVADAPLRRFLTDLPAHTLPRTRLVGSLSSLVNAGLSDALEIALRHDVLIGTPQEVQALVDTPTHDEAVVNIQSAMRGSNLRALVVFLGPTGCQICTPTETWEIAGFPVREGDCATASAAFTAGIAYGIASRWSWPEAGRFANALGSLSTWAPDPGAALPSLDEVKMFLEHRPPRAGSS